MAKVGVSRNYQFSQKNHWRRTIQNEVLRRTNGREKSEFVLYLAGPQDNDRRLFISKGVPADNLFAIDLEAKNIAGVKAENGYGIAADVLKVLASWPSDRRVCAVMLDFCSGLELSLVRSLPALLDRPVFSSAAIAVNLQRGRDRSFNEMRSALVEVGAGVGTKHRGEWFIRVLGAFHLGQIIEAGGPNGGLDIVRFAETIMNPRYFTYRSGRLVFDSVVFSPLCYGVADDPAMTEEVARVERGLAVVFKGPTFKLRLPRIVRRLAAQMAVRTMRQRGSFPVQRRG